MKLVARRPSPALVIACLALFVSLSGVSYGVATGFIDSRELRDNTIRTEDLRNNEVRGKDIRNSTIGGRDVALDTLTGGDINESRLAEVPSAAALGGVPASGYLRSDTVGFTGLTPTANWSSVTLEPGPAVDVDPLGYVHLRGLLERDSGSDDTAIVLPAAARPAALSRFITWSESGPQAVEVQTDGDVEIAPTGLGENIALDGITFRAR